MQALHGEIRLERSTGELVVNSETNPYSSITLVAVLTQFDALISEFLS